MIFFESKKKMLVKIARLQTLNEDLVYERMSNELELAEGESLKLQIRELEEDLIETKRKYYEVLVLGIKNKETN